MYGKPYQKPHFKDHVRIVSQRKWHLSIYAISLLRDTFHKLCRTKYSKSMLGRIVWSFSALQFSWIWWSMRRDRSFTSRPILRQIDVDAHDLCFARVKRTPRAALIVAKSGWRDLWATSMMGGGVNVHFVVGSAVQCEEKNDSKLRHLSNILRFEHQRGED